MDINEMYMITLEQEILNEKAARILADIHRMQCAAEEKGDFDLSNILEIIALDIAQLKPEIITNENSNRSSLNKLKGKFDALEHVAKMVNRQKAA